MKDVEVPDFAASVMSGPEEHPDVDARAEDLMVNQEDVTAEETEILPAGTGLSLLPFSSPYLPLLSAGKSGWLV